MAWHDDLKHPFAGIVEKLKRADENIVNLKSEIDVFIQTSKYPVIPHVDEEMWKEAVSYHREREIPIRFGVLVGEIVHHLRSCMDHVAWHFSAGNVTSKTESAVEFPIFETEPLDKKAIERYERKVQAITNAKVLDLIKEMQPYKIGTEMANHALLIINNMDRFDKHRELVIVSSSVEVTFPPELRALAIKAHLYSQGKLPLFEQSALGRALQNYVATPGIAFQNFGTYRTYPVIKGLAELWTAVRTAVTEFVPAV